ncbi:response regulator [Pseudoalteromonas sp. YIC-827]|uniref:histidine kinase n=1 Tax=Pseudoalteromonas qingdaonensis TaxID=3131913 RepID=A0ABU9MWG3_9GAMM
MLDTATLFYTSAAAIFVMALLNLITWRANRNFVGIGLYVWYPVCLLVGIIISAIEAPQQHDNLVTLANFFFICGSVIHVLAINRFLNYNGLLTYFFIFVSAGLFFSFTYFMFITVDISAQVLLIDLHRFVEAACLFYIISRYGRSKYPSASLVYLIALSMSLLVFAARSLIMTHSDHSAQFENDWFSAALLVKGVLAPMLFAAGVALFCNERRELNLNQLTAKTQKDLEIRGMFLSTISHEIRTPLNGILGSAQLIMNQASTPKHKPYCEAIINSAESLTLLIDKVLEYASLEQSDEALYEEDVELHTWLNNLCLLLSPLAEQKGVKFELNYNLAKQACYYCDHQKLRQILINLVGNAIKFTDQGQVTLQVDLLHGGQEEHTLGFSVIDSGPGIEEDEIQYLTEPYVQSSAGKLKGGSGLGLAITSRLLAHLGSKLHITSRLGEGSTFSFAVKLTVGELSLVEKRPKSDNYRTGLDVLLVEDLELNQKIAIEFMAEDEHKVKLATDGSSAIELLKKHHFDVVLLDMNLPDFNGQEVIRKLKSMDHRNHRTPILAFTASLSPDEVKEYLALGIKDIVGKPIKQEKLRQALSDSQSNQTPNISVALKDVLYDETAAELMANTFAEQELSSIYNEFVLSARNKLLRCQQLVSNDKEQCIKLLHRQASTALQLGFNRYGMALKKIERRLLDGKPIDEGLAEGLELWQQSLEQYLKFMRSQTLR